jgi:hypothetical protein
MARVFFDRRRRDVARLALKTETFEEATQVGSGAAIAIQVNLLTLRHAPFHLLKFAFQTSGAFAQGELRLAQHVAAAGVLDMADNKIVKSARPSRVWIPGHKLFAATRDGRARPSALRACSLALTSAEMIFSHAHGGHVSGHLYAPIYRA